MFKVTCLVALKEKIGVLIYFILRSSYTCSCGLHSLALKRILLTLKHIITQMQQ
jgi:hypothetical protein